MVRAELTPPPAAKLVSPAVARRGTIPALSPIERMAVERPPVTAFIPRRQAARAFRALWTEGLRGRPAAQRPGPPEGLALGVHSVGIGTGPSAARSEVPWC